MLHMVVEQTKKYPKRMVYHAETDTFTESEYASLLYVRNFTKPYGWIKESGTPPKPHWDCMLMTDKDYELGEEASVRVIGVFRRNDGDHKFVVVERERKIEDFSELEKEEREELARLYPRVGEGEGWFGKKEAQELMLSKEGFDLRDCSSN